MIKNMKKAFIDQIMLGLFLISSVIVFVATVSDEAKARSKYTDLKHIVQTAALSSSKYYTNVNNDTEEAQNIALGIIENSRLGIEVKDDIVFTWDLVSDPNNVVAKIENYKQDMFWYKMLGWDSYTFDKIESKANIISIQTEASDFLPIAVNGCSQDFVAGTQYDFLLKAYDIYTDTDTVGWFALSLPGGGQSSFAHFKNIINLMMVPGNTNAFRIGEDQNFYMGDDDEHVTVATVESSSIENDVMQIAQAFNASTYSTPMDFSIAVLDCNSTADNPILKEIVQVTMNPPLCANCCQVPFLGLLCGDAIPFKAICMMSQMFDTITNNVFSNDDIWEADTCNKSNLFKINFEVKPPDANIVLEY